MRRKERKTVMGLHAPGPHPTGWAALIVATLLSFLFLVVLGLWRLGAALLG